MTPSSFRSWRVRLYGERGQTAAAKALGCSRTSVAAWERGCVIDRGLVNILRREHKVEATTLRPIPVYIALACQALANGLPPMN